MFTGPTRPDLESAGPDRLVQFLDHHPGVSHLAIGGVTPDRTRILAEAGCRGVAACSAICGSRNPGDVVRAMRDFIETRAASVTTGF
jgi:thiamine monophosphate synthase